MNWWVYENWTVERGGKAIVHRGDCSFCREGQGFHKEDSGKTGNGMDHLVVKKLRIPMQNNLIEQGRNFAAFVPRKPYRS